jgi:[CysO sulfur-carrier protein]-S-L-cysteine hydrolase
VNISAQLLDELLAHVLEDPRNEVCGVVAVESSQGAEPGDTRAVAVHRAVNVHASPLKFEIDPAELLALYNAIEDQGQAFGAIYHSHVHSAPYPSQTDINFAANWPGLEWIIVGLSTGEPDVRSYLIDAGSVRELPIGRAAA